MSRPTSIRLFLDVNVNDDNELVCFFCKGKRCELTTSVSGGGETRIVGVHSDCAEKHHEKQNPATTAAQ